jgi:hypothetical protein
MAEKPNILVLWGDDIGISNLSCYSDGLMGYQTPNIDRIANDGTCWNEKPAYIQLFFSLARLRQMATDDPALREKPHFRAAYEGDMAYFAKLDPHAGAMSIS